MTTSNMTKLTRQKLKSPRLLMILSTLAILATGVATIVSLAMGGYGFVHYIFPSLMVMADVAFLILTFFTNYRFRHAIPIPLVYLGITALVTALTVLLDGGTGGTDVFTHFAFYSFIVVHLLAVLTVVFAYLHAAGAGKRAAGMRNTTAIAFLLLVASVSVYSYSMFVNGWFGQGALGVERTLEYSYDESDDTYVVSGVLNGRGDTIVVPAEFNGIRVKAVDCSIFDTPMVTKVYLNCDTNTELENPEYLYNIDQPRTVYVAEYQHFGEKFLRKAYSERNEHYLNLVNQMQPTGLSDDEVYVTFTYSYDDLLAIGGNVLPMWVGQRGDVISAEDFDEFGYIAHPYTTEDGSENKLWAYENINKRIFKNVSCFGKPVTESINCANVEFETLYKVTVNEDNDTLYDIPESFRYADVEVAGSPHIFAFSEVDGWLDSFEERPGFDYTWTYTVSASGAEGSFDTLSAVLADGIEISPVWTMKAPTIGECVIADPSLIYGETATFSSSATAAIDDFVLSYTWSVGNTNKSSLQNWAIDEAHPDDSGKYTLLVTSSYSGSSLTSTAVKTIDLAVAKRPIRVEWTTPDDTTYTGYNHSITLKLLEEDMFKPTERDIPTLVSTSEACKDANTYVYTAELATLSDRYEITDETESISYTIVPKEIDAEWYSSDVLTYNGEVQRLSARFERLANEGTLDLTVTGERNAGSYEAVATSPDSNYVAGNNTKSFTILPLEIDLVWTNTSFVFNNGLNKPSAAFEGVGGDGTIYAAVSGEQRDAGIDYVATATISNTNYTISDDTVTELFTIEPCPVNVAWSNVSLTYNGQAQKPTASARDLLNAVLPIDITFESEVGGSAANSAAIDGNAINVASYVATGTSSDPNYVVENPTQDFEIIKRVITLDWNVPQSGELLFTYNTEEQQPFPTIVNGVDGEEIVLNYSFEDNMGSTISKPVNASIYAYYVTAALASGEDVNLNYEIDSTTQLAEYKINPATVDAVWTDIEATYNTFSQICVTAAATGIGEYNVPLSISNNEKRDAGSYTAGVSSTDSNYVISAATETCDYVIKPYTVELNWIVDVYTYSGYAQAPTASTVVLAGDSSSIISINSASFINANVGTAVYTAVATSTDSNYTFSNPNQEFTILPLEREVVWSADSVVYNGKVNAPTAYIVGVGYDGNITMTVTGNSRGTNVGAGYLAEAVNSNTNYTIINDTKDYSITPYTTTVSWSGTSLTYNGSEQKPIAKIYDLATKSYVEITVDGAMTNAGSYTATASISADHATLNSENYILSGDSKNFTIAKKSAQVTWSGTSGLVYNGNDRTPTATITGVGDDGTITLAVTLTKGGSSVGSAVDAGNYSATAALVESDDVNNYTITGYTRSFMISKATATVTWSNADNFTYDGVGKTVTATFKDVNGNEIEITTITLKRESTTLANTNAFDAGSYSATASIAGTADYNTNYTLSGYTKNFTVSQKSVTVQWSGISNYAYNGTENIPTATITGVGTDGQIELTVLLKKDGSTVSYAKDAGSYTATASLSNSNYKISSGATQTFEIAKKGLTIDWGTTMFVNPSDYVTVSINGVTGVISGEDVKIVLSPDTITSTTTVWATLDGDDADNYYIINASQRFTIQVTAN